MSKIDANTTLQQVLEDHKLWLKDKERGSKADLSFANLSYANLSYANLNYADLSYADLRYAERGSKADLSFADLRSADLSSADLRYADLRSADLRYADLRSANLRYADLSSADLRSADLRYADLPKGLYLFQGSRHRAEAYKGRIRIGCEYHTVGKWLKEYKTIGAKAGYSKDEIKDYGDFIKYVAKRFK